MLCMLLIIGDCVVILCLLSQAASPAQFATHLKNALRCFYQRDAPICGHVTFPGITLTVSFTSMNLLNILQVKYTEGSVLLAVVNALATPVSTSFWYLFASEPNFHWMPRFDVSTVFVLIGMVIMVPSIVLYAYFGDEAEHQVELETERRSRLSQFKRRVQELRRSVSDRTVPRTRSAPLITND